MNPEIKAAIMRYANDYITDEFPNALEVPHTITFKRGAECGYKLGVLVGKIEMSNQPWLVEIFKKELQELLGE